MSKVSISGNASGTGTFTIASPNGNTDRTINLPDSNGTILTTATAGVPIGGPAFSAYLTGAQTITSNVATKVTFQAERFDTNSAYDATTNYRFQPLVAGYYQVTASLTLLAGPGTMFLSFLYKNGSQYSYLVNLRYASGVIESGGSGSQLVYLNGSTDYVEIYAMILGTGTLSVFDNNTGAYSSFSGAMVRSAT